MRLRVMVFPVTPPRVIAADRTVIRYQSRRDDESALREKLRDLAHQRRRFGYRRLHILLRRDGVLINRKKTQRLYREEGLTVRRRKGRKRAVGAAQPALEPGLRARPDDDGSPVPGAQRR